MNTAKKVQVIRAAVGAMPEKARFIERLRVAQATANALDLHVWIGDDGESIAIVRNNRSFNTLAVI